MTVIWGLATFAADEASTSKGNGKHNHKKQHEITKRKTVVVVVVMATAQTDLRL